MSNGFGDNAIEDTSINVSGTNYTVPAGMTLYITADSGVKFGSTNTNVADVDGNGKVEIADATLVQRFLAEYYVEYPAGERSA